jgi:hypothetical protein
MRKKVFNLLSLLAIVAVIVFNVTLVTNADSATNLKWKALNMVLASSGDSGGSDDEECKEFDHPETSCSEFEYEIKSNGVYCNYAGFECVTSCVGTGDQSCISEWCQTYHYICTDGGTGSVSGC